MLDEDVGKGLLPAPAPSWLRVVVSARDRAADPAYWRRRLGWYSRPDVGTLPVEVLDEEGVRQILQEMQLPSADRNDEVAGQLFRLSGGFPLLVRLYVNLLKGRRGQPFLRAEDLQHLRPDLTGFFEGWRRRLADQSKAAEAVANRLLAVLATALGPLSAGALSELAQIKMPDESLPFDQAMEVLSYFLEGDETGYAFSHPEFGYHIVTHEMKEFQRRYWRDRFLDWGRRELDEQEAGRRAQVSPNTVQLGAGVH
jgi:hypothetical protein